MLRRLVRLQLGLAAASVVALLVVDEWVASGAELWKKSTNPPWSLGERPKASHDVKLTSSHSGNCLLEGFVAPCRSLDCNGYTGTLTLNSEFTIGNNENPEGNIALRFSSLMGLAGSTTIRLAGTHATPSTIDFAGKSYPAGLQIVGAATATYQLTSAIKLGKSFTIQATGTAKLEVNGQTIECTEAFSVQNASILDLSGKSKIVLTGVTTGFSRSGIGAVTNASESTIEVGAVPGEIALGFTGGGYTYGTVKLGNFNTVGGANTFAVELAIQTKNAPEGKGVRLTGGETQTLGGTLTTNGTEAEPARLESSSETVAKIKVTGTIKVSGTMIVKNVEVVGGGKIEVEGKGSRGEGTTTGFVFPGGEEVFSGTAALRSGSRVISTGSKAISGVGQLSAGARAASSGAKTASGASQLSAGASARASGLKAASGAGTALSGAAIASTGAKVGQGVGILRTGARVAAAAGAKTAGGSALLRAGASVVSTANELIFSGTASISSGIRAIASGVKVASGQGQLSAGAKLAASAGAKTTGGTGRVSAASRIISAGRKTAFGSALIRIATRILEGTGGPPPPPAVPFAIAGAGEARVLTVAGAGSVEAAVSAGAGEARLAVYASAGEPS